MKLSLVLVSEMDGGSSVMSSSRLETSLSTTGISNVALIIEVEDITEDVDSVRLCLSEGGGVLEANGSSSTKSALSSSCRTGDVIVEVDARLGFEDCPNGSSSSSLSLELSNSAVKLRRMVSVELSPEEPIEVDATDASGDMKRVELAVQRTDLPEAGVVAERMIERTEPPLGVFMCCGVIMDGEGEGADSLSDSTAMERA